jgi:hypothetical protein
MFRETPVQRLAARRHPTHDHIARTDQLPTLFNVGRMEDVSALYCIPLSTRDSELLP